jgi:hypothetical protein
MTDEGAVMVEWRTPARATVKEREFQGDRGSTLFGSIPKDREWPQRI